MLPRQRSGNPRRRWCPGTGSNSRHRDFQSRTLPIELSEFNTYEMQRRPLGAARQAADRLRPQRTPQRLAIDRYHIAAKPLCPIPRKTRQPHSADSSAHSGKASSEMDSRFRGACLRLDRGNDELLACPPRTDGLLRLSSQPPRHSRESGNPGTLTRSIETVAGRGRAPERAPSSRPQPSWRPVWERQRDPAPRWEALMDKQECDCPGRRRKKIAARVIFRLTFGRKCV